MQVEQVLSDLGLSEGEIRVYLALLKLGSVPVRRIKEETRLHRTTVYDFIEKLLNKGLIHYSVKGHMKHFNATHPKRLLDFLREKQDRVNDILPELINLNTGNQEEVAVEVYQGTEGLKTCLFEHLKTGNEVLGFGIDEALYKKALPVVMEQLPRLLKENNVKERILTKTDPGYLVDSKQTSYKFVSSEFFSPLSTTVFGNNVEIAVWEPSLTTILIRNKQLADAYKKHFNNLWNQEIMTYHGIKEVKWVFDSIVDSLGKGQSFKVFGIPLQSDVFADYFDEVAFRMDKKGIVSKLLIDERAKRSIKAWSKYPTISIRTQKKEFVTPAEVDIYNPALTVC